MTIFQRWRQEIWVGAPHSAFPDYLEKLIRKNTIIYEYLDAFDPAIFEPFPPMKHFVNVDDSKIVEIAAAD